MCNMTQVSVDWSRVGIALMLSQAEPFGQARRLGACGDIQRKAKQCQQSVCGRTAAAGDDCSLHRVVKRKMKRYRIYGDNRVCMQT